MDLIETIETLNASDHESSAEFQKTKRKSGSHFTQFSLCVHFVHIQGSYMNTFYLLVVSVSYVCMRAEFSFGSYKYKSKFTNSMMQDDFNGLSGCECSRLVYPFACLSICYMTLRKGPLLAPVLSRFVIRV